MNKYTPEGREYIHKGLERIDKNILHYLMRNPVRNCSVEFNDNRLSLYCAQQGKCAVSGVFLEKDDVYCHHRTPKYLGGKDNYKNLVIVSEAIHKLIHANNPDTIFKLLNGLNLNVKQIKKLNQLRKLAIVHSCFVIPDVIPDGTPCEVKVSCTV